MPVKLIAPGKRKNNRYWIVRDTIGGQRIEVSTQETDRVRASEFANRLVARLLDGRTPQAGEAVTFKVAAGFYIAERKSRPAEVWRIERLYPHLGAKFCADIRRHDLIAAADALYPAGAAASKNRNVITPASAVLHYAADREWAPYRKFRRIEEIRPLPRSVETSAAARLVAQATESKQRLFLLWLFCHGTRLSQTLSIRPAQIDLRARTFDILDTKTRQWLRLSIHPDVFELLANDPDVLRAADPRARLWPWWQRWQVYRWLRPMARAAGVEFTPHRARHSMATWMIDAGVDLKSVMEAGGWRDIRSVMHYAGQKVERVRAAAERLPALTKRARTAR